MVATHSPVSGFPASVSPSENRGQAPGGQQSATVSSQLSAASSPSHARLYFAPAGRQVAVVEKILVIDDDAMMRRQITALLAAEGYGTVEARNGREGVALAAKEKPNLVLCDITMPEMNGHRVLEAVRADGAIAHLPFIFLTGWGEKEDLRTGMNLGADDYLVKPVEPADLLAAVRTRAGNANVALSAVPEPEQAPSGEIERQLIYTLNPLLWREAGEVGRVPAFALVGLPKGLLPVALRHHHVDHLNARRVQTLMHVHGSGRSDGEVSPDDPHLVDLDALAADETERAEANVA